MKKIMVVMAFIFAIACAYTNVNAAIWKTQILGVDQHGTPNENVACSVKTVYKTTTQTLVDDEAVALYWVMLSTGASGNYAIFRDTGSIVNSGATTLTTLEIFHASSTQNTQYLFDPPASFANGMTITDTAANTVTVCTRAKDSD
jgi:hypothetical protein